MPNEEAPSDAAVEDQLRQAHQALSDADGARDAGLSDAVIINRRYYACFHAAQAALYDRRYDPRPMAVFSPCSGLRSSVKAMHRAKTVAF